MSLVDTDDAVKKVLLLRTATGVRHHFSFNSFVQLFCSLEPFPTTFVEGWNKTRLVCQARSANAPSRAMSCQNNICSAGWSKAERFPAWYGCRRRIFLLFEIRRDLLRIFSPMLSALTTSDEPLHFGSSGTFTTLTSLSHTFPAGRMYLSFTEDSQIFTYLSTRSRKVEIAPEHCTAHGQAHWDPRVSTFLRACLIGSEHRVHFCHARPRDESRQLR